MMKNGFRRNCLSMQFGRTAVFDEGRGVLRSFYFERRVGLSG
jgi:hypothetical protein